VSAAETVRVETAGATRTAALSALHCACFRRGWSRESMARLLATPGAKAWLAWMPPKAPEPCGFALVRAGGGECELVSVGVLANRRRRGVGLALAEAWLAWAKAAGVGRCFLEAAENNAAALALYAGLGFVEVGRRPGYYVEDAGAVSALILSLDLTK
jgi:[ribosomal protein S18]-alanine N-acetyltransferase